LIIRGHIFIIVHQMGKAITEILSHVASCSALDTGGLDVDIARTRRGDVVAIV
jgi:hypothetical protein